jgi:tRNA G18 (ribose-2'-O)-methylase SpoU
LNDVIAIDDPDDPRIAPFRQVRERDVAGRHGGFIAEGEVVLRVLARSRLHRARCVLVAAKRVQALAPILSAFPAEVEIFAASQGVMDSIAGFHIHRGILAFGERGPARSPEALLADIDGPAVVLGLFGISNHDNIGGVFRNAAAFGVRAVLLDGACCDPLYRKAIRVSVGAALEVPFARLALDSDPIELMESSGFAPLALSPGGSKLLTGLVPPDRAAVLLGAEGAGLPPEILARATTIGIPMAGRFDSLNVATTSGIVLHYLSSYGQAGGTERETR